MMARSLTSMIFALCIIASLLISQASAGGDVTVGDVGWLMPMMRSGCKGTIAECLANTEAEEEFELDSESNRRILATRRYISYGALPEEQSPLLSPRCLPTTTAVPVLRPTPIPVVAVPSLVAGARFLHF
ncbi:Rapid alkalinization factor [Forsythia ovata]|uniref:Rapid alkalinization factor n=1 Tax=Forsythia ovata TaxID=205694 RepID=A0ABD1TQ98_9LAMI